MTKPTDFSRIAVFLYSFRGGGAEKMMVRISNELYNRGYDIELIVVDSEGPMQSQVNRGINIKKIRGNNSFILMLSLWNCIWKSNYDAVISTLEMPNILSTLAAKVVNSTPIILRCANTYSNRDRAGIYRLIPILKRLIYPMSDSIISVSNAVSEDMSQTVVNVPEYSTVIYNPAYDSSIVEKSKDPVNHKWLNDENKQVIISIGSLTDQKNYEILLRGLSELHNMSELYLVILGQGNKKETLIKLALGLGIRDYVSFEGFVDNPHSYTSKADVFVLSSAWEGCPNVIIEAMACGTSIVCTDCPGGSSELLDGGEYGSLVPVCDEKALADAIWNTLNSPTNPSVLRSRAKEFDIKNISDQYERVLKLVLE
jgi:glycosyltransferase involved in cell wall biosynthesis